MSTFLFFTHHTLNLLWGVVLSASFCGVRFTRKNTLLIFIIFTACGIAQLSTLVLSGGTELLVWKLYPLIVHLPLVFLLCFVFKKRLITAIVSFSLAYLCCQPSKWFGLRTATLIQNNTVVWLVKIFIAILVTGLLLRYFSTYIANLFNRNTRSVLIFGSIPLFYYGFDYVVGIYTNLWTTHYMLASELLSLSLCIFFMLFTAIYYKEYEQKIEAEHKEQIISITAEQRAKEIEAFRRSNLETSLLRHDMRLMLSNLSLCITEDDKQQALKMISGFSQQIEATALHRYCKNATLNYILTNFENKCTENNVDFHVEIGIDDLPVDEILFSSIISNALDNALNAQNKMPASERQVKLMLKNSGGKLLLSVKNPFRYAPVFVDGLPAANQKGHGYGTQSILYMTEKLGGKCQFTTKDHQFILRVIL